MATQLFFGGDNGTSFIEATTSRATNTANLVGNTDFWDAEYLGTSRGNALLPISQNTVAGPTNGVELAAGGQREWVSPPVSADVTISGAITANLWAAESNMSANVAINFVVDKVAAIDNAITEIVKSARTSELPVTTRAAQNFTATPGAGVTLNRGDRLRVRVFGDDSTANMGSGFNFSFGYAGPTAAADGDSYLSFTETFSFESDPSGTVIYLTDTASSVSTASVDREAWTSRGAGVQTDVVNTTAGFTAPIQMTDTAGGTVVDWFTKPLSAFTLTGMAKGNVRLQESSALATATARVEIARVDGDGTNASIWCSWCADKNTARNGELHTSEAVETFYLSGNDLAISDGQRIRIRVYIDDAVAGMVTGHTATLYYAGTSGGASGDTFFTFAQTLTEFSATPKSFPNAHRHRSLIIR